MTNQKLEILSKESYLTMIANAVGSNIFRTLYALVDGVKEDILQDGDKSCAYFVSSVLYQFKFIASPHATVSGLERDLKESGWHLVDTPHEGDILIWESISQAGDESHSHTGFYIGNEQAVSNSYKVKTPVTHHMIFGTNPDGSPARSITAIYTHDVLA